MVAPQFASAAEELHAAVAHRQIANELRHLGAPDELVVRSLAAAVDEHDHARRQLELAGANSDWWSPPALPIISLLTGRNRSIAQLGAEAFADGLVGEAAAARAMRRAASTAEPEVREHLLVMAADEERHASLAADIVRWALRESRVTRGALRSARRRMTITPPDLTALSLMRDPIISRLDRVMAWGCALDDADLIVSTLRITAGWSDEVANDPFRLDIRTG